MEKATSDLTSKIKALKFRIDKTVDILDKEDKEALQRHKASIASTALTVNTLKEDIEEKKFAKGESEVNIENGEQKQKPRLASPTIVRGELKRS